MAKKVKEKYPFQIDDIWTWGSVGAEVVTTHRIAAIHEPHVTLEEREDGTPTGYMNEEYPIDIFLGSIKDNNCRLVVRPDKEEKVKMFLCTVCHSRNVEFTGAWSKQCPYCHSDHMFAT